MSFLINCAAYMMRHLRIYFISTGNFFWGTAFKQSEILFKTIKFVYWLQSDLFNFWICFIKSELFYYYATSCVMTNRNAFLIEIYLFFFKDLCFFTILTGWKLCLIWNAQCITVPPYDYYRLIFLKFQLNVKKKIKTSKVSCTLYIVDCMQFVVSMFVLLMHLFKKCGGHD